jgi:hypothetical protein
LVESGRISPAIEYRLARRIDDADLPKIRLLQVSTEAAPQLFQSTNRDQRAHLLVLPIADDPAHVEHQLVSETLERVVAFRQEQLG